MRKQFIISGFIFFLMVNVFSQTKHSSDYLLKVCDVNFESCGYVNTQGDTIIPDGKYITCYTDTFRTYAIVTSAEKGIIAIDRKEHILYEVFPFENGPDYSSEGLFRIIVDHKIGYASANSGSVVIKPQYECAWPFENGLAKVSLSCKSNTEGENTTWVSDDWFYIDKTGKKVNQSLK